MPFIEQKNRIKIRELGPSACENVGDLCFVFYDNIMQIWGREPRWRTAHRLFKEFSEQPETNEFFTWVYDRVVNKFELEDVVCASKLAYIEFYRNHVSFYEDSKKHTHGDII